jgi:serralysin
LGGVPNRPATACSEKNVLKMREDGYGRGSRPDGENVCVHELAHAIMNIGLSEEDRRTIRERYRASVQEQLWAGDFATKNADEFFAEMSQAYFCANPQVPAFLHVHGINCAVNLGAYDPATFALLEGIYRGSADLR